MLGCLLYCVLFVKEFSSEAAVFLGISPLDCFEVLFFLWKCISWREAVAYFVAYLGNKLFSPLGCILLLR